MQENHTLTHTHTHIVADINPLDNLKVAELRKDLSARGVNVAGILKPELTDTYNELRQGLNDVPAILQPTPQVPFEKLTFRSISDRASRFGGMEWWNGIVEWNGMRMRTTARCARGNLSRSLRLHLPCQPKDLSLVSLRHALHTVLSCWMMKTPIVRRFGRQ